MDFLGSVNPWQKGRWDKKVLSDRAYRFNEVVKLPFDEKIEITNDIILTANKNIDGPLSLACSFGKDSVVMLHLVKRFIPDITIVFNNTGVEYQETMELRDELIDLWGLNVVELHPEPNNQYFRLMRRYGFPGTVRAKQQGGHTPKCCFYLKEKPMIDYVKVNNISGIFVGLMGSESINRRSVAIRYGGMHYLLISITIVEH